MTSSSLASSAKLIVKHPHADSQLVSAHNIFESVSLETLSKLVLTSKPTTCLLDPLPAKLFENLWPSLGPTMLNTVNVSLVTSAVPTSFKSAVVKHIRL